jgi:anti-sigma regulatory factor (Ser/Thr protein kinase)
VECGEKVRAGEGMTIKVGIKNAGTTAAGAFNVRFLLSADKVPDAPDTVLGDPTRLHQLFMNLCTNAVQAMGGGGAVELSLAMETIAEPRKVRTGTIPPGEYVRISVRDTGHGIAPEVIDRIFEPFFTTKPAGRGTGLGLALVHSVVMEHKGFLDVASELGRGTTFTVWIPHVEAGEAGAQVEEALPMGAGQVVLAVDDEVDICTPWRRCSRARVQPVGFNSSHEALAAVRANPGASTPW